MLEATFWLTRQEMVGDYAVDPVHETFQHHGIRMVDGQPVKLYRESDLRAFLNDPNR